MADAPIVPIVTENKTAWVDMPVPKPSSPETYDPQKRTFIKKPEVKLCPTCGQPVQMPVQQMKGAMSVYVNAETGKDYATIADNAETLTIDGVVLTRKDKWMPKVPAPVTPPATTK